MLLSAAPNDAQEHHGRQIVVSNESFDLYPRGAVARERFGNRDAGSYVESPSRRGRLRWPRRIGCITYGRAGG